MLRGVLKGVQGGVERGVGGLRGMLKGESRRCSGLRLHSVSIKKGYNIVLVKYRDSFLKHYYIHHGTLIILFHSFQKIDIHKI